MTFILTRVFFCLFLSFSLLRISPPIAQKIPFRTMALTFSRSYLETKTLRRVWRTTPMLKPFCVCMWCFCFAQNLGLHWNEVIYFVQADVLQYAGFVHANILLAYTKRCATSGVKTEHTNNNRKLPRLRICHIDSSATAATYDVREELWFIYVLCFLSFSGTCVPYLVGGTKKE